MSTITRRSIVRGSRRLASFHRDHFAMVGVDRGACFGAPGTTAKRVVQGRMVSVDGLSAFIFSHPTKRRTKGRMCWAIVGVTA